MKLDALKFRHVGPFGAQGIALTGFTPGLNVVCETNEFGKSTVLSALELLLYKPFSSADKQVKALHNSASDDGPEGEIGFTVDGRSYVLHKRFLKQKGARLQDARTGEILAKDRNAEERLAALLQSDQSAGGPSGLLWVRQGTSMDRIRDDGQVASRLEGELGTLVGGDRARDYLARAEADLAEYETRTGQVKKSGPLRLAIDAVEATEVALSEARRLRDTTRDTGRELARLRQEIAAQSGEGEDESLTAQIKETRTAVMAAQSFANELALLDARREQAQEKARVAGERQAEHITALTTYNRTLAQLAELKVETTARAGAVSAKTEARDVLRGEVETLERQLSARSREQDQRAATERDAARLDLAVQEMQRVEALLAEIDALSAQHQQLTAELTERPDISREDVMRLRQLSDRARQLDSDLGALGTPLHLELDAAGQGKAVVDGQALSSGPFELTGGAVLHLDGIGTLRSDDRRLRDLAQQREAAQSDLSAELERLHVTDMAEAVTLADARQDLAADLKRLTTDMTRLAPQGRGVLDAQSTNLQHEIDSLSSALADQAAARELNKSPENADGTDLLDQLRDTRARLSVLEEELAKLHAAASAQSRQRAQLDERLAGLGLGEDETARTTRADTLAAEKLRADADARAAAQAVETAQTAAPTQSLDQLKARLSRLEQVEAQSRERMETLKTQAAALQARRDAAFEGEDAEARVGALEDQLDRERRDLARHTQKRNAARLLRDTLTEAQSRLREAYTAPVARELAPLLSMVFPGVQADLDEGLGVETILRDGRKEAVTQLSGGTQEQFAILTRLAYARLLSRGGASAPVILDDALVYTDDGRRDAMFDVLGHVSQTGTDAIQILYLSCHKGATRNLGGHRIVPALWES